MEEIKKYLDNPLRVYSDGLYLYERYGKNKHILALLNSKKRSADFLKLKLETVLAKLCNYDPPRIQTLDAPKIDSSELNLTGKKKSGSKKTVILDDLQEINLSQLPTELQDKYSRNKDLVIQLVPLHIQLHEAKNDKSRKKIADQLILLDDELASNWEAIDDYLATQQKETGKKAEKESVVATITKFVKRRKVVKDNISRANKELTNLSGKKLEKRKESIVVWEKELSEIDNKLVSLEQPEAI